MGYRASHRAHGVIVLEASYVDLPDQSDTLHWQLRPPYEIPRWSRMHDETADAGTRMFELAAGWPLPALTYSHAGTSRWENGYGQSYRGEIFGRVEFITKAGRLRRLEYLPRRPIAMNLLLDTAFWAIVWLALLQLSNLWRLNYGLRRRLKKRCAACGYDQTLLESLRCPECGRQRKSVWAVVTPMSAWPAIVALALVVMVEVVAIERFTSLRGLQPIHQAAFRGDRAGVERELERGVNINIGVTDRFYINNSTALTLAAHQGHESLVAMLIECGSNLDALSDQGNALTSAIIGGHLNLANSLIEAGVPVNTQTGDWREPLVAAIRDDHTDMVASLVRAGADVNAWGTRGMTPLSHVTAFQRDPGVKRLLLELLLEAGADPNGAPVSNAHSPLANLVSSNDPVLVEFLLDAGAMVDLKALIVCIERGDVYMLDVLIDHGADLSVIHPRTGLSLFGYAPKDTQSGQLIWDRLAEGGADVNAVSSISGWSVLMNVASTGGLDFIRFLLEHGADPTFVDPNGQTAQDVTPHPDSLILLDEYVVKWKQREAESDVEHSP